MARFVYDTFTDTNLTSILSHTGETGATWTTFGGGGDMSISTNSAARAGALASARASGSPATADYYALSNTTFHGYSSAWEGAVAYVRVSNSDNDYYRARLSIAGGPIMIAQLHKCVGGTLTQLGSNVTIYGTLPSAGTAIKLECRAVGSTIKLFVDDVEKISATDTSVTATGKAGCGASGSNSRDDGFSIDSFEAWDVSGSSDTLAPTVPASLALGTRTASTLPFTWSASTDNGGGSVSGYKIQVLDNADTVLSTVDVGNVLTYTISSLSGNTLRKLRVAAYDNAVPANQSAYSSSVSGTTLSKTATVTVKDVNGSAQASETSLRWAACTGTIGSALAVVAQGTAETTDGSGNCVLDLNGTALSAGNSITVILADDSPTARLGVLEAVTVTES
jgi:hypothetical protein